MLEHRLRGTKAGNIIGFLALCAMFASSGAMIVILKGNDPGPVIAMDLLMLAIGCLLLFWAWKKLPGRLPAVPFYLRAWSQLLFFFDPSPNHSVQPLQPSDGLPFVYAVSSIFFSVLGTFFLLFLAERRKRAADGAPQGKIAAAAGVRLFLWFFWYLPNGVHFAGYTPPLGKAAAIALVVLDAAGFALGCLNTFLLWKKDRRLIHAWPFLLRTLFLAIDLPDDKHWLPGDWRRTYAVVTLILPLVIFFIILMYPTKRRPQADPRRELNKSDDYLDR